VRSRLTIADRLLTAVPLVSIYLWLSIVYCIEAWKRTTPWLFTDELEMTQISRAIASTGHAARRGEPYKFRSLYTYMIAPLWWIDDVAKAFSAVKYVDVLVMTSVIFPTYFLARPLSPARLGSLRGRGSSGVSPSLAYSSWIVEETLALPVCGALLLPDREGVRREEPRWGRRRGRCNRSSLPSCAVS